jgi:hypothetical protein
MRAGAIGYDGAGLVSVVFTFNMNVNITGLSEGWQADKTSGTNSFTVTPLADVEPGRRTLSFTAANSAAPDRTTAFAGREVIVTSGAFTRTGTPATYTTAYFDEYGAAGIIPAGGTDTEWFYINEGDAPLRAVLEAAAKSGAPALFRITVAQAAANDSAEIIGTEELPEPADNHVYIDIGLPDNPEANALLPEFIIPFGQLGKEDADYSHIKLRVNRNARLVIEAGVPPGGYGNLAGAGVEVEGGGRLRSEADGGFPLGQGSYVISRLNSYLEAGDKGLVIGPASEDPVFAWGTGDQNGGFVEIREVKTGDETWEGRIRFDANLTARKTFSLGYSVWFIRGPSLTVSVPDGEESRGLFAEEGKTPRFYGTVSHSGGQNIARPAAKIIVNAGNSLSGCFVIKDGTEDLAAGTGVITVTNVGTGSPVAFIGGSDKAYFNWKLPE